MRGGRCGKGSGLMRPLLFHSEPSFSTGNICLIRFEGERLPFPRSMRLTSAMMDKLIHRKIIPFLFAALFSVSFGHATDVDSAKIANERLSEAPFSFQFGLIFPVAGLHSSSVGNYLAYGGSYSLTYFSHYYLVSLYGSTVENYHLNTGYNMGETGTSDANNPGTFTNDIGLLVGIPFRLDHRTFYLSGGPAKVHTRISSRAGSVYDGNENLWVYKEDDKTTLGLLLQGGAIVFTGGFQIGVVLFTDVNPNQNSFGINWVLGFGGRGK